MVAKSYQDCPQIGDIFKENGRAYVYVQTKSNPKKKVRWYTETEYQKMYPDESVNKVSASLYPHENDHILKTVLGFGEAPNDFIYLPKGYTEEKHKDYFYGLPARRCGWWGWFFNYNAELPNDMPEEIELVKLPWEAVGNPDGTLKPRTVISTAVKKYL